MSRPAEDSMPGTSGYDGGIGVGEGVGNGVGEEGVGDGGGRGVGGDGGAVPRGPEMWLVSGTFVASADFK